MLALIISCFTLREFMRPPLFSSPVPLNQEYHNQIPRSGRQEPDVTWWHIHNTSAFVCACLNVFGGKEDTSLLSFSWLQPRKPVDKNAKSHTVEETDDRIILVMPQLLDGWYVCLSLYSYFGGWLLSRNSSDLIHSFWNKHY